MTEQRMGAADDMTTIDNYIAVKDLRPGRYHQVFLIHKVVHNDSMVTGTGSRFARVVIKDITGEIDGVLWNFTAMDEGGYYRMAIDAKLYRGELEFTADFGSVEIIDTPLNAYDYVKGISEHTLNAHAELVQDIIQTMDDEHYRNILGNAIQRLDLIDALRTSPYGLTGPMAYKGGLLVRVANSLKLIKVVSQQVNELETPINTSLVIASCILRNIGWHTSTCFINGHLRPKDAFYMTGVNRASARYIDHLMMHVESDLEIQIPEAKKQALENSCNEIAEIKTLEGRIAATVDDMIDLIHFGGEELLSKSRGNWTNDFFTGHNER